MINIIKTRITLWLLLAMIVCWLFFVAIVPGGAISYQSDFRDFNFFIDKLSPKDRVDDTGDEKKIIGDPVYFTLRTPRHFDRAKLTVKYRNESSAPVVEAGVLADNVVWRYDLKPLDNAVLDDLLDKWTAIYSTDNLILLQREKVFDSMDDFLKNPPETKKIAQYNYDLKKTFIISGYKSSSVKTEMNQPLRGTYQFYVYLKNEKLDINFTIKDINKNLDSDLVKLNLYYDNDLLISRELPDDGIQTDKGEVKQDRLFGISELNLPEGVYKIEVKANDDIITEKIVTNQKKISFINNLWLAGRKTENFNLYTDSQQVFIKTTNPASLQNIRIGDKSLEIKKTYKQYDIKTEQPLSEIYLSKNDIIIAGDGVFSFNKDALFNPSIAKVDANFNPDKKEVDFIIARYQKPLIEGEYKVSTAEFDLAYAYLENNKYGFIISVPGLKTGDKNQGVVIKEISINLVGKSLWEKIKDYKL